MSKYRVVGASSYRGHEPGEVFEATLERAVEFRAVRRGSIVLVERGQVSLVEGSYRLPVDAPDGADRRSADADQDPDQSIGRDSA